MTKFVTKEWIEVIDFSSGQYSVNRNIRFKTLMLRSDLCDYSDAYIAVKRRISVAGTNANNRRKKKPTFKNNTPFRSCISKINNTFVNNAEDLDIVMPVYNLLEYKDNYSIISGSLWNYCRDEVNDAANENKNNGAINFRIKNDKTTTSKSSEYKTKLMRSTPDSASGLNVEVVVPLEYLSNFWRSLDLPLINCEVEVAMVK